MTMSWHKQNKGESPCVECRKRRIRCQRPFPCQYCVKQGLAEACLQGSIVKGTRSLKASSIVLHEDLAKLSVRERVLEQAIAEIYSGISTETHPLLVRDSQIRTASPVPGLQRTADLGANDDQRQTVDSSADDLVASMGLMTINGQYHGETATSEYLIKETDEKDCQEPAADLPANRRPLLLQLPPELVLLSVQFPLPPDQQPPDMNVFLQYIPCYERALQLVHIYHSYFAWCTMLAPSIDTIEYVVHPFYPDGAKIDSLQPSDSHRLAFLFMIFLLGTLYDLDLDIERVSTEVEEFHTLARAAMASYPIADHPTLHGVQAMLLMIWYFRLFPARRPSSYQWVLTGVVTKVVQSMGLHRNCSGTVPDLIQRAPFEQTFWEYYCVDIWQSFMFGRPTSMVTSMIDCRRPTLVEVPPGQNPEFFPWKYSFTQLVCGVIGQMTNTLTYADMLKHEKKLKTHYTPISLEWPPRDRPLPNEAVGHTFQRYITAVWRNVSVMYIHRRWMVEMIQKYKDDNPTTSPHWGSAVVAYESARALVHDTRRLWQAYPRYIERMAPFWSHTTSAALVLGALVAHVPGCDFAEDALQHLDETCNMFADAKNSLQPPNSLPALRKVQRQARHAFNKMRDPLAGRTVKTDDVDMSLSPSEAQFPFTFGDSPPQTAGGAVRPSHSSDLIGSDAAIEFSSMRVLNGVSGEHDANQRPRNAWGQLISQMAVRC